MQDLISKLLERKPAKRLGMLSGRAADVKRHRWFEGLDWEALEVRQLSAPRKPKEADAAKRLKELLEAEKKSAAKPPKESPEELAECEKVFTDF
jgi:cGMP-dependent protein kinase 2